VPGPEWDRYRDCRGRLKLFCVYSPNADKHVQRDAILTDVFHAMGSGLPGVEAGCFVLTTDIPQGQARRPVVGIFADAAVSISDMLLATFPDLPSQVVGTLQSEYNSRGLCLMIRHQFIMDLARPYAEKLTDSLNKTLILK
jgi:hypothetical protein